MWERAGREDAASKCKWVCRRVSSCRAAKASETVTNVSEIFLGSTRRTNRPLGEVPGFSKKQQHQLPKNFSVGKEKKMAKLQLVHDQGRQRDHDRRLKKIDEACAANVDRCPSHANLSYLCSTARVPTGRRKCSQPTPSMRQSQKCHTHNIPVPQQFNVHPTCVSICFVCREFFMTTPAR